MCFALGKPDAHVSVVQSEVCAVFYWLMVAWDKVAPVAVAARQWPEEELVNLWTTEESLSPASPSSHPDPNLHVSLVIIFHKGNPWCHWTPLCAPKAATWWGESALLFWSVLRRTLLAPQTSLLTPPSLPERQGQLTLHGDFPSGTTDTGLTARLGCQWTPSRGEA